MRSDTVARNGVAGTLQDRLADALATAAARQVLLPAPAAARAIRIQAGLKQRELADLLEVHRVTVTRWELGVQEPDGDRRVAYAKLLNALNPGARVR